MATVPILQYPDPRLAKAAARVEVFDEGLSKLIADMADTMYAACGVGLAATQIDVHQRVVVIDLSATKDQLQVFVNPEIVDASGEAAWSEEACLSVPGVQESVRRAVRVVVRAQNAQGARFEIDCEGRLAVCIQHEIDHLAGKVLVDHLSPARQLLVRTRLGKRRARRS